MRSLTISDTLISDATDCYIIAEIGHNHGGDVAKAAQYIRAAAAAGASAVKFQKRNNKSLYTHAMYNEPYLSSNSYGATYGAHREALELAEAEYRDLMAVAAECGVDMFATAFDLPSVDFLVALGVPAIKIASGDVTNTPLLAYAAKTGLPLIVSTGGATMDEVRLACEVVLPVNPQLALLQCTAVYPTQPGDLNLSVISSYREEFTQTVVGLSTHDCSTRACWLAYALGARVLERHFTLDRRAKGSDHHFSMEPEQFAELASGLREARMMLGSPTKSMLPAEAPAIVKMGKKLVAARNLQAGHVLTEDDVTCKSPGDGLKPYRLAEILGRVLTVPRLVDDAIRLDDLEPGR
jgi:sialic acid synthase